MALTVERLRELLDYDPETGVFTWKVTRRGNRGKIVAGAVAGRNANKARQIFIDRKPYLSHRLAWLYVYGEWPALFIDHIDGDPHNNRIANLRLATNRQNQQNRRKLSNNVSGLKGVYSCGKSTKWRASIFVGGRYIYLGRYADKEQASAAYDAAAHKHFGEFART